MNDKPGIPGYRTLSQADIALVAEGKAIGAHINMYIEKLRDIPGTDARWLDIGKTDMQQGLMALIRAITHPDNF